MSATDAMPAGGGGPLGGLSAEERALLAASGSARVARPGEVLFRLGERGDGMYVIERGEVEIIFEEGRPGKRLGPGDFFGELALLTPDSTRTGTAVARTDCALRLLRADAVAELEARRPAILCSLLRKTCAYLVASEQGLIGDLRRRNEELERALDYLRRTREELDRTELLAQTDELTGLYNRRCFQLQGEKFVERARAAGGGLALVLVDVDEFKSINDRWGHPAGDAVLKRVGSLVRAGVSPADLPCRIGGDEFALLLAGVSPAEAAERAERLRRAAAELPVPLAETTLRISFSVGGAAYAPGDGAERLFERADAELYRAKKAGRNCSFFEGTRLGA